MKFLIPVLVAFFVGITVGGVAASRDIDIYVTEPSHYSLSVSGGNLVVMLHDGHLCKFIDERGREFDSLLYGYPEYAGELANEPCLASFSGSRWDL